MTPILKRIIPALAVLAIACAQVFGLTRGYECHHQEVAVQTSATHCHQSNVAYAPCTEEHGAESDEHDDDPDQHAPLKVSTEAGMASGAGVPMPSFVAVLLLEQPALEWMFVQKIAESLILKTPLDAGGERPPPASLQVARCMVILV